MRAGYPGPARPKGSFGDWATKVGVLAAGFAAVFVCLGSAFGLGVEPLLTAHRDRSILRQVVTVPPGSTSDTEGRVVLRGRIDSTQPVPVDGGGLGLVDRESWRTDMTWAWELIHHPEFELLLADGSVRVVNGCRREESDWVGHLLNASKVLNFGQFGCYRLGGKWVVAYDEGGHRRFLGFRPGDEVHVVGTLQGNRLHAASVFGGSPEDYAATLRNSLWPLVLGLMIGLALVAGSVLIGYMMLCCARRPAGPPGRAPALDTGK